MIPWNLLSSIDSQITLVSVSIAIYSIIDSLVMPRLVVFSLSSLSLEWISGFPPSSHTNELSYFIVDEF